jgi:hypothetical protein
LDISIHGNIRNSWCFGHEPFITILVVDLFLKVFGIPFLFEELQ